MLANTTAQNLLQDGLWPSFCSAGNTTEYVYMSLYIYVCLYIYIHIRIYIYIYISIYVRVFKYLYDSDS